MMSTSQCTLPLMWDPPPCSALWLLKLDSKLRRWQLWHHRSHADGIGFNSKVLFFPLIPTGWLDGGASAVQVPALCDTAAECGRRSSSDDEKNNILRLMKPIKVVASHAGLTGFGGNDT